MVKRKPPSLSEKLVAVLLTMHKGDGTPIIPPELRDKPARDILRSIQWDHSTALGLDGADTPSNLQPLTVADHAVKTKRDVKAIAKAKRGAADTAEFVRKMLAKVGRAEPEDGKTAKPAKAKRKWGSAPIPGSRKSKFKVRLTKDGRKVEFRNKGEKS